MKKLVLSLCFIGLSFYGYTQNEVKPQELTSPIMLDFLKNYQEKNAIQKVSLLRLFLLKEELKAIKI